MLSIRSADATGIGADLRTLQMHSSNGANISFGLLHKCCLHDGDYCSVNQIVPLTVRVQKTQ